MKLTTICTILSAVLTASATPWHPHKPEKPTINIHNPQLNVCGNGVTPYCCNNEAVWGGKVDCKALDQSGICDTTIVCCNARNSVQSCVGNVNIEKNGW